MRRPGAIFNFQKATSRLCYEISPLPSPLLSPHRGKRRRFPDDTISNYAEKSFVLSKTCRIIIKTGKEKRNESSHTTRKYFVFKWQGRSVLMEALKTFISVWLNQLGDCAKLVSAIFGKIKSFRLRKIFQTLIFKSLEPKIINSGLMRYLFIYLKKNCLFTSGAKAHIQLHTAKKKTFLQRKGLFNFSSSFFTFCLP